MFSTVITMVTQHEIVLFITFNTCTDHKSNFLKFSVNSSGPSLKQSRNVTFKIINVMPVCLYVCMSQKVSLMISLILEDSALPKLAVRIVFLCYCFP